MRRLSDKKEDILLRRARVTELHSKGMSDMAIAEKLGCSRQTVGSDMRVMVSQSETAIQTWAEKKLPHELETISVGIKLILRKAWNVLDNEESSEKAIFEAMHIILECYERQKSLLIDKTNFEEGRRLYLRGIGKWETLESLKDRQMREAYEEERHRSQAVF